MAFTPLAVLLVLCTVLVTAHSKEWSEGMLFANVPTVDITSANSKTKISGDYHAPELRQICLREVRDINCQSYGCPRLVDCDGSTCKDCQTEESYQTELACCKDKDDYGEAAAGLAAPSITVGTCDWTFDYYQCDPGVYGEACDPPLDGGFNVGTKHNAVKYGSVWGTCYFNADAESCGHPFCDKMVMSFQGGVYNMPAYVELDSFEYPKSDCSVGRKRKTQNGKGKQEGLQKTTRREGGEPQYQLGTASVVSGPVTVTSLNHHMEFNRGILEWVEDWSEDENSTPVSTCPTDVKQVVPFTLTVTLASSGGSDDYYAPRVDEGAYDHEGHHN